MLICDKYSGYLKLSGSHCTQPFLIVYVICYANIDHLYYSEDLHYLGTTYLDYWLTELYCTRVVTALLE